MSEEEIMNGINNIIQCEKIALIGIAKTDTYIELLQGLLDLYNKEKEVTKLQERIIKLMISDFQSEGIFKDMKYESIIEYYIR